MSGKSDDFRYGKRGACVAIKHETDRRWFPSMPVVEAGISTLITITLNLRLPRVKEKLRRDAPVRINASCKRELEAVYF